MNFQITQGTGTTIATDIGGGGENYQKIKLIDATPGSTAGTGISSNPLRIDPTGTTPQPITGTLTANIGTTGGLALDATVASLVVSQGSVTSGQEGPLIFGAVSTSVPSYATGTSSPLSLTLTGALRVDGSAVTQPISGTVTAVQPLGSNLHVNIDGFPVTPLSTNLTQVGGSSFSLGQTTMTGSIPVAFASDQSALPPTKDVAVTGTLGSLVDTVVINCNALSTVGWTTSGTWSGTMVMEVQYGDGQWYAVEVMVTNVSGGNTPFVVTSWTESLNDLPWITNVAGAVQARIRFTTYNSGTATIVFNGSVGLNATRVYNLNPLALRNKAYLSDGLGNYLTSTLLSGKQALDVNIAGGVTINVSLDHTTDNVLVYGNDGTTDRKIKTDTSGNTQVVVTNFPATTAVTQSTSPWVVSGTVAATQSGTWNINNISGTISLPTGASTEATLAGIKTDTDKFTFTSTRLLVDGSGVTQPVSGTITANAGSGNFTVIQPTGTNLHAVIDSGSITVANATLAVTQSGTWNINNISGTISLPTGAATSAKQPALGTAGTPSADVITVQGAVGMTALKVDGSGVTQPISGSVTANIGTTNGLALDATVSALQVVQGSTTSGQHGTLIQGAVTTAAPAYSTGQTNPLSLTTNGALRVDGSAVTQPVSGTITANIGTTNGLALDATLTGGSQKTKLVDSAGTNLATISATGALKVDGSAVTQPVSGTVTANQGGAPWADNITQIAGSAIATAATGILKVGLTDGTGNAITSTSSALDTNLKSWMGSTAPTVGQKTMANSLPVVIASDQTSLKSFLDISTSGTIIALNGAVTATLNDMGSMVFTLTGTWVATVVAEGSEDNTNWVNLTIFPASGASTAVGVTVNGTYRIPSVGAYTNIRLRASAFSSGTVNVSMNASQVASAPQLFSPTAVNAKVDALSSKEAQSFAGNTFGMVASAYTITPANADQVAIYIKNPSGSGKTLVLQQIEITNNATSGATDVALILWKLFANPTSSANGTAATINTTSVGSGATTVMTAFTTPTVSANGSLLYSSLAASGVPTQQKDMTIFRLAPNNNLLITLNSGVNNAAVNVTILWSEE